MATNTSATLLEEATILERQLRLTRQSGENATASTHDLALAIGRKRAKAIVRGEEEHQAMLEQLQMEMISTEGELAARRAARDLERRVGGIREADARVLYDEDLEDAREMADVLGLQRFMGELEHEYGTFGL